MLRAHWIIQVYTGDWDSNIHVDDTFMDSIDVTNKDFNIGDFGTNCHFGSHVLLQGPDPNTLRKVERKNICGGQVTLTFIHEILISWGQTFHFSEYLTSLFFNSPILSSVDANLPWSPPALINYWMTWSPRSRTSPPPRSRACNIGILERVRALINVPQGWLSTQVPSRLSSSCGLTWSSASPCWACVATVCWQVK